MFFNKLKNIILEKRFRKRIKEYAKNRTVTHKEIKTVAVLTTHDILTSPNFLRGLPKSLHVDEIKTYTYQKFDKKNEAPVTYFSEKDFGLQGNVLDPDFKRFLATPFDLLIAYFTDENEYLEFASLFSKATFKVGFANVNSDLFDMEIVGNTNNLDEFNSEMIRYLKILKKVKRSKVEHIKSKVEKYLPF